MRTRISAVRVRWDTPWALHARRATKWVEKACGRQLTAARTPSESRRSVLPRAGSKRPHLVSNHEVVRFLLSSCAIR
jgi:hypothetical protein